MSAGLPQSPGAPARSSRRKSTGVIVPQPATWRGRLAAALIYGLIRLIAVTVRFSLQDRSGYFNNGGPPPAVIFALWHNRLALSLVVYRRVIVARYPARRMAALVSASRDGGRLARALELFGVQPVRGSSSRRGPQALLELTSWAGRGYDLAVTPDGPRGPCYEVQEGVMALAQLTGLPVLPVSYRLPWKVRPNSWDRFQIPLPFSRCEVSVGEPVRVPREAGDAEREALRLQLQNTLRSITRD